MRTRWLNPRNSMLSQRSQRQNSETGNQNRDCLWVGTDRKEHETAFYMFYIMIGMMDIQMYTLTQTP